jgi:hypothetical protein
MPATDPPVDYDKYPGLLDFAMRLLLGEPNVFEIRDEKMIEFFRDLAKKQPP